MKLYKRIIAAFSAVVICFSLCFTSVFAAWYNDLAYLYTQSDFLPWAVSAGCSWAGKSIGTIAGSVVIPGFGTVSGELLGTGAGLLVSDGIDVLMNYLAQDSSFVSESDYVASLDNSYISSLNTSGYFPLYLSSPSEADLESALDLGYILDYSISENSFHFTEGASMSSKYGSHSFYFPQLVFYTSEFTVAQSDTFKFYLPGAYTGYGYVLYNATWGGGIVIQVLNGSSWTDVAYVSPSYSSVSSSESDTIYTYESQTFTKIFDLQPGYTYRIKVFTSSSSKSGSSAASYYGKKYGFGFSGISIVSATDSALVPSVSTRPSSFVQTIDSYNSTTNNYNFFLGKSDANGTVTNVYDSCIFNESTNTFTDPKTEIAYQVESLTYDYATRTYFLTLEDDTLTYNGNPVKHLGIIYGDEQAYYVGFADTYSPPYDSVEELLESGDLVFIDTYDYVIAKAINNGGTTCSHVYTSETVTAPTCTEAGVRRYTCSLCGATMDTEIAATGHTWEVTETVDSVLDDNGDVKSVGYKLYTCSSCGETYKQWNDTGQPGPSTGTGSGGSSSGTSFWDRIKEAFSNALASLIEKVLTFITDILGMVLDLFYDLLSFFFDFLSDSVIAGIGGFFSAFMDGSLFGFFQDEEGNVTLPSGVAAVFAFISGVILALPVELRSLLIFGTAVIILIAVFKIVRS